MRPLHRIACWELVVVTGLAIAPAAAAGAGGPVPPVQGGAGISAPDGGVAFVAEAAPRARTVVQRVSGAARTVDRRVALRGRFGVPGAGFDGTTTGLSADGRTLVLAQMPARVPAAVTRLVILDARTLRPQARIALPGSFGVDAISPSGRWLYLIHTSAADITRYAVRAYDLRARRLLGGRIVDRREPDEVMQGVALTRATSPDGRWAYTLYDGSEGPFIHALDTEARAARCIDLPALPGTDPSRLRLVVTHAGRTLEVRDDAFTRQL